MRNSIIISILLMSILFLLNTAQAGFFSTFDPNPIPEPSTGILMILGLLAGVGLIRNKRKQTANLYAERHTTLIFWGCCLYILVLWGPLKPFLYRAILPPAILNVFYSSSELRVVWLTLESFLCGLLVPILFLTLLQKPVTSTGIRLPDRYGWMLSFATLILLVIPGLWLLKQTPNPWGSIMFEVLELASMVPEHFLIFGVLIGLAQPLNKNFSAWIATQRQLMSPPPKKVFFHAGMLMPFQLKQDHWLVVIISSAVFCLAHSGAAATEVAISLPVGFLFAYVSLCSASIWPALVTHWLLNVVLFILDIIFKVSKATG